MMVLKASKQESVQSDWLKWLTIFILLLAGLVANHYYSDFSLLERLVGWMVLLGMMGGVAFRTTKGQWAVTFIRDARLELRKIVWPTREETIQTTLVVALMVTILALFLWGVDAMLVWLIGWMTG